MAKKTTNKKEATPKKAAPKVESLKDLAAGYFERFPNSKEFHATEDKQFFFKIEDAVRNAKGGKVSTFKRDK